MEEIKVKIHGHRLSSYCTMLQCALKLKGVSYEFIEEDLINKSQTLIQLNPVYHKVPVLVVDGKPILESLVILEYIDEVWNDKDLQLLPKDPYVRARIRFWAGFIYQKLLPNGYKIMLAYGEEQDKAVREFIEYLNTLEDGLKKEFPGYEGILSPFVHGEKPGLLDLVIGSLSTAFKVLGKVAGVELLMKERTPLLCSYCAAFVNLDIAKDLIVPHDELFEAMMAKREKAHVGA
ncbi:Glutathione transferase protein [Dioscorea alata]|uniref:Glutathione transferase protein n=1 Tax=Dioscorea alata TaxID=55571 RepID=A0ACB7V520_DIOAL|nr:Glutathione transferase protein [Dioscorea alata]